MSIATKKRSRFARDLPIVTQATDIKNSSSSSSSYDNINTNNDDNCNDYMNISINEFIPKDLFTNNSSLNTTITSDTNTYSIALKNVLKNNNNTNNELSKKQIVNLMETQMNSTIQVPISSNNIGKY